MPALKVVLIYMTLGHVTSVQPVEPALSYAAMEVCQIHGADVVQSINRSFPKYHYSFECIEVSDYVE